VEPIVNDQLRIEVYLRSQTTKLGWSRLRDMLYPVLTQLESEYNLDPESAISLRSMTDRAQVVAIKDN